MKKVIFTLAVVLIAVLGVAFYGSTKAKESYDRGVARLTSETLKLGFYYEIGRASCRERV